MKIENFKLGNNKGFTLMEVLMVIAIFTIIASITFYFFGGFNKREVLEKDVNSLTALVRNARLLSVASKNASPFGIHLESDKAVLFEGNSYVMGGPNEKILEFSREIYMSAYSINNGDADIVFARLTGETLNYGTIKLSTKDDSASTTITILRTGVIQ